MSVELDPPELGFRRPFSHEVTQSLRLTNPSNDPIAFKVKTTAPKQYCVRPNSGKIDPCQDVEVQVLLQAMKEDPQPDARCRDKFLVQTVALAPDHDASNISGIWQNIEKVDKSSIQERKIRVVFLPTNDGSSTPSRQTTHGQHLGNEAPPAYNSPAPSFGSPGPTAVTPVNHAAADNQGQTSFTAAKSTTSNMQSTVGAAMSNIADAVPASSEELRAQLANAKTEISSLTQRDEQQSLRQRKSDAVNQDARERIANGSMGMGILQQPAEGVPVQIVAALCLLSFLLAYYFF